MYGRQSADEDRRMQLQYQWNKEAAAKSQEYAKEMFDYTGYENQVKQMKAAGLNPALLNGEYTLFLRKGKAKTINNVGSKMVHEFDNILGNKLHPTEKPVDLMKLYITNSSNENDIVLDPFIGSGTTAVACIESNRKFIGYEIDKQYYDIAMNRIENSK